MRSRLLLIMFAPVLLLAVGCGAKKLNENRTLTLDGEHAAQGLVLPAQKTAQKVTIEFSSSDGEVSVYVFKDSDIMKDDDMFTVVDKLALAKKRGKADSFSVELPENTATRVVIREHTAMKTNVTLKVTAAP